MDSLYVMAHGFSAFFRMSHFNALNLTDMSSVCPAAALLKAVQ